MSAISVQTQRRSLFIPRYVETNVPRAQQKPATRVTCVMMLTLRRVPSLHCFYPHTLVNRNLGESTVRCREPPVMFWWKRRSRSVCCLVNKADWLRCHGSSRSSACWNETRVTLSLRRNFVRNATAMGRSLPHSVACYTDTLFAS